MPFINLSEMTIQAVEDCLAQTIPTRVLLIDQGSGLDARNDIDRYIDGRGDQRVLCWHNLPSLPSLSLAWNRALDFVWELGGEGALVVNNDVRLHRMTVEHLQAVAQTTEAWFVSAIGVREKQFEEVVDSEYFELSLRHAPVDRGGPDFSCFYLTKAGHAHYRFDEAFIPAYNEDLDCHRRYMLGGHGDKIFGINLPFLHYASQTVNRSTPEQQAKFRKAFEGSRAYYLRKWGGPVNQEVYRVPFGVDWNPIVPEDAGTTTPDLQRYYQAVMRGDVPRASTLVEEITMEDCQTTTCGHPRGDHTEGWGACTAPQCSCLAFRVEPAAPAPEPVTPTRKRAPTKAKPTKVGKHK
jgi:hypothetical protein